MSQARYLATIAALVGALASVSCFYLEKVAELKTEQLRSRGYKDMVMQFNSCDKKPKWKYGIAPHPNDLETY